VVIGAGVVGVCTAYSLARQGRAVRVLDGRAGPGQGTTFINGTLICPSLMLPWTGPKMIPKLIRSFTDSEHPLKLHPRALADPLLWRFGLHYLMSCRPGHFERSTRRLARLANYSRRCLDELLAARPSLGPLMSRTAEGTLQVFESREAMQGCLDASAQIRSAGVPLTVQSPDECGAAGADITRTLREQGKEAMYIFSGLDTNGDCHQFTRHLARACEELGVRFEYGASVSSFRRAPGGGVDVLLEGDRSVTAKNLVLCAGVGSPGLAAKLGLYLPMYPVKGYIITVPLRPGFQQLPCNVVQDSKKVYLAPMGRDSIRVSGCAEFAGFDATVDPQRARQLLAQAAALMPGALDTDRATFHAGLRPLSADDVPIIGMAGPQIFLNTGHGSKGWTHAFGSGQLVADLVAGRQPALAAQAYGPGRFWPVRGGGEGRPRGGPAWAPLPRPTLAA